MTIGPDVAGALVVWLVVVVMYAVRAGVNLERRRQRRRDPFTWHCPACRFACSGNDPGIVLTLTTNHERTHRP